MLKGYHAALDGATFDLLPAIDLAGGRVVRLRQGDFAQETRYGDDPVAAAVAFAEQGARWLHVVDLDGARAGEPRQPDVVTAICRAVGTAVAVEVAGGLRSEGAVDAVFDAGAVRAVVGTAALRNPAFAARLVERLGGRRIAAALDVRGEVAVGGGWQPGAPAVPVETALRRLADAGVRVFQVTAVQRDGMLAGPDLALLARLLGVHRGSIIASGGIASVDDLVRLRALGCSGAILGRSLYEGRIDLQAARETLDEYELRD